MTRHTCSCLSGVLLLVFGSMQACAPAALKEDLRLAASFSGEGDCIIKRESMPRPNGSIEDRWQSGKRHWGRTTPMWLRTLTTWQSSTKRRASMPRPSRSSSGHWQLGRGRRSGLVPNHLTAQGFQDLLVLYQLHKYSRSTDAAVDQLSDKSSTCFLPLPAYPPFSSATVEELIRK